MRNPTLKPFACAVFSLFSDLLIAFSCLFGLLEKKKPKQNGQVRKIGSFAGLFGWRICAESFSGHTFNCSLVAYFFCFSLSRLSPLSLPYSDCLSFFKKKVLSL